MAQAKTGEIKTVASFRGPGAVEWRELGVASVDEEPAKQERAKRNKEELNNTLLASLQMQHLVVLAGSGCSLSAGGPSMRDLWIGAVGETPSAPATKVARKVNHNLANENIEELLSRAEAFLHINDDEDVEAFRDASKKVILDKCSGFAMVEKLDAHMTFLHRLSRRRIRDQRLKIFTTNYDLCFERAAGELGGVTLDGFSFTKPRRYDPRYFSYDIIRRPRNSDDLGNYLEGVFLLYKLHGSVNWAREKDGTIVEDEQPEPQNACLIYPATGKYQQSFTQPHLESMGQYLAAVREPNTCMLVVGFGFKDDHLAEPLLAAAKSNPHLRLILVARNLPGKTNGGYWKQLADLGVRGEDIWFVATSFEDFAQMIPDLKSLTPGDALMKAIQGVARER